MTTIQVFAAISEERDRQDAKWGVQDHSDLRWLAILVEELGEAAAEVITKPGYSERRLKWELVQVAAVAIAWVESIDRRTEGGGIQ